VIAREDVHQLYSEQFAAALALHDFAQANRPERPNEGDAAGLLLFRTYVRATKSYQAAYKLCCDGYGGQSFVVGRTLYEDMLVSHWIVLNRGIAPDQFERHRRLMRERLRQASARAGLTPDPTRFAPLTKTEYEQLAQEWGHRHHWTKLGMDALKKRVQTEFPEADGHRRLLNQVDAILHRISNLVVHHSYYSLSVAVADLPDGRQVADVGVSPMLIPQALFIAFFGYVHLITLTLLDDKQEDITKLWHDHRDAFTTTRDATSR
jgi:Family of unknown function (DUF5677)